MARLRGRDLAALGALGTAAAMAMSRGKKGETKTDAATSSTPASVAAQSEKVLSELGEDSGFRRNLETGELYEDVLNKPAIKTITTKPTTSTRRADQRTAAQEAADDAKIFGANAAMEGKTASGLPREARGRLGPTFADRPRGGMKKGGSVKSYKSGGKVSSASKRADGIAIRGKTRGRMV
jgi:hypothetical protein